MRNKIKSFAAAAVKPMLALVLIGFLTAGFLTACGSNRELEELEWNIDDNEVLTISGTGPMKDYGYDDPASWSGQYFTKAVISNEITSIGSYAFYECSNLTDVSMPGSVKRIESFAFGSTGLTSVTIPNSVNNISETAFAYCDALTYISVDDNNPSFTSVDGVLFSKDEKSLICYPVGREGEYTIPDSVSKIEDGAFATSSKLADISIPESITDIGYESFIATGLTRVTIPANIKNIGECAFADCENLTYISVDDNNPSFASVDGVLFSKDQKNLICYPAGREGAYAIPDGVAKIAPVAFMGCSKLADISIPESVTDIGDSAFLNCNNLASVTIFGNVTNIGKSVFSGCKNLTISAPESLKSKLEEALKFELTFNQMGIKIEYR